MIITEIEYHVIVPLNIGELFDAKMKSDLSIIIPDVLLEFKGGVLKLQISPETIYVHFSSSPDASPRAIIDTITHETSTRLIRVNKKLNGFKSIFKNDYLIKTGTKPSKRQIADFLSLLTTGI